MRPVSTRTGVRSRSTNHQSANSHDTPDDDLPEKVNTKEIDDSQFESHVRFSAIEQSLAKRWEKQLWMY